MYKVLIRPILFTIDPERAHRLVFRKLRFFQALPGFTAITRAVYGVKDPQLEREVFGIRFPNPVGMAAGFDKDAVLYKALGAYGFGFVEIGTLTPRAQPGNPQPRLFRLPADKALINRMGFNNGGVEAAVRRLRRRNPNLIIGGNIGKNKNTPNEEATADYVYCFNALFDHVDYFAINVSSPNTPNLRELQDVKPLTELLNTLESLNRAQAQRKPILLKIAPDVSDEQLADFVTIIRDTGIDGIIATNTTVDRAGLRTDKRQVEALGPGGLSGAPLRNRSTEVISRLSELSRGDFPIVAVGGIFTADDVREKLDAGASLVQIYTGFVYEGPGMVRRILRELIARGN